MILVTGGLGFVGSHTTRALLDLGESCVLVQRREPVLPDDLAGQRVFAERADVTDLDALLEVGTRHQITGIIHLAGSVPWPPGAAEPVDGARTAVGSLLNVLQAARDWQVPRVAIASTIGVYGGVGAEGLLREDVPLPMAAGHVIPAFKKIGELLADYLAGATGRSPPRSAASSRTRGSSSPKAAARPDPVRGSASISAGSARTPAISPPTTHRPRSPITSPGCAQATTGSS
jgi:UDP-glucose 4-epimerase